ncbi:hypothetical protein J6590_020262 [Homalodisca vitripennis]|nr:hypothetical protein J6590_020262 [Homalodisca vitripennis]
MWLLRGCMPNGFQIENLSHEWPGKTLARLVRSDRAPEVLAAVQLNPNDSSRRIAIDSGMSQSSVVRILKDNKMYPYKMSLHQELHATSRSNGEVNRHNMRYWLMRTPTGYERLTTRGTGL